MIERMKEKEAAEANSVSNLSQSTLDSMKRNKELVDSGQLPKYIGDTTDLPSNPEEERKAKRVYDFSHILAKERKSRNDY